MRIGVLGAGQIGSVHARVLAAIPDVEVAGIADVDEGRARTLAASVAARPCPDLEALLAMGLDAVVVAIPNALHAEVSLAALERGVDVFCEKPMATTLEDARRVLEAVERTGRIYQLGFNRRFAPAYAALRAVVTVEMPVFSGTVKMTDGDMRTPAWFANPALSGGFIYDTGIHLLDTVRWLLGPVRTIRCLARSSCYPDLDDAVALLEFRSGALVAFHTCGHATWTPPTERVELFGDHAAVATEGFERFVHTSGLGEPAVVRDFSALRWEERLGYVQEDQAFVRAVVQRRPSPVAAEDAYRAVELVAACYRSAGADGTPVVVG